MKTLTCRWCGNLATGIVHASGGGRDHPATVIPHCDGCFDRTLRAVVEHYPVRTWKTIEQPDVLF